MIEKIGNEWYSLLKNEFNKDYMIRLSTTITKEREKYTVYPEQENVFRVFKGLQPSDIKVIILGQDPYHDGSADGFAFSNSKSVSISPSLRNIFAELEKEYDYAPFVEPDKNLLYWVQQGVFLSNTILTVRKGEPLSHQNIGWETFTMEWLTQLSNNYANNVYILWGTWAKSFRRYINENNNLVLTSVHPSPLSANRGGWFGNNHFKLTNEYLEKNKRGTIRWM